MNLSASWLPGSVSPFLLPFGPRDFMWAHGGRVMVGRGDALRIEPGTGPSRFRDATEELESFFDSLHLEPDAPRPVAFGSFTFDPDIPGSVLVVPSTTMGFDDAASWSVSFDETPLSDEIEMTVFEVRYAGSSVSEVDWLDSVARAVKAIEGTELKKVVLARDIHIWSKTPFDVRTILSRLYARFPDCYTFAVDGFIGATPELLIRKQGSVVQSLVLAGSAPRAMGVQDDVLGRALLTSEKDLDEHVLAVDSVRDVLGPMCSELTVSEPRLLKLANVQHLATDVTGQLSAEVNALEIAAALHPTAAVCGTPRESALETIRTIEGLNRGRYAGPVGWVDAAGDGEWGIALRCAEIDGTRGRLFAGGGIVAASEPEDELEETRIKFHAMMSALEGA